jgi:1,4-alpha-glucan branching enzyme
MASAWSCSSPICHRCRARATGSGWREAVNTDSSYYGGSDVGNLGGIEAGPIAWHNQPFSAEVALPPLGTLWLVPEDQR